jgi:putative inorganic carbon (hco3(-)) transporter
MNSVWQQFTLMTLPLHHWRGASYLHQLLQPLRNWRQSSWLLQWADAIGLGMAAIAFAVAPFVSTSLIGIMLAGCGAFWLLLTLTDEAADQVTRGLKASLTPIHLVVCVYWSIAILATAASPVKRAAFQGFGKLTLYLLLFMLLARVLRSARLRSWLITVFLHIALIVSVYGLRQWFFGAAALATWVDPESPLSKTTRVFSFLGNPNLLAAYLLPAIAFSVAAIFVWKGRVPKMLAVTMGLVNTACLVLTFSRGGLLGLLAMVFTLLLLLVYWWSPHLPVFRHRWALPTLVGGTAGVLLLAIVVVPPLRERVASMFVGRNDSSNNFRFNVWASVLQMIKARPILGIGPGNDAFNKIYPLYQRPRFSALSAYSIFLEEAVELGLIGLGCFIWLLVVTFNQGFVQLQRLRNTANPEAFWLIGAIVALAGELGQGLFDTVLHRPEVSMLWWLAIAMIASFYPVPSNQSEPKPDIP